MLKKFNLVQHGSTIMIKVLTCKGGTALRKYRLCFIVLCSLMDNFQHFCVTRPIWSVIMSGKYIRCAGGEMGRWRRGLFVVAGKPFGDYALSRSGPVFKQTFSGGCSNVKLFKRKLKTYRFQLAYDLSWSCNILIFSNNLVINFFKISMV